MLVVYLREVDYANILSRIFFGGDISVNFVV